MSTSTAPVVNYMDRSRASSTGGMSNATDATRRTYLAQATRRRPPPRFRPHMIIILVLSAGLILIGLTMTIIGLWPSYSPSGGNPLQIVGPIMLGMGLLGLIGSIVNICYKREQEKKQVLQTISDMRSSRMTLTSHAPSHRSMPVTPTPSVHARPSKGILKASSTSTYNGTTRGSEYESDSGMANTHSFSTNRSYERDSNASDTSRNMDNIKVEMLPDPTAYRHGKPVDQSSTSSDQGVPPASMTAPRSYNNNRQPKPQPQRSTKPTYNNQGYSPDARETDIDGDLSNRRQMQSHGYGAYDAYDQQPGGGGGITGSGLGGGGGITGGGALGSPSPYTGATVSPQSQQITTPSYQPPPQQQQQRQRWGSKSPRTPTTAAANAAYSPEQEVSTVSAQYQQATEQYGGTPQRQHYTSYAHSGGGTPSSHQPSSSTEV